MKKIVSTLMMICLALCAVALAEADDPVVVRVGDVAFTKSQLRSALDSDITLTQILGQAELTDEERRAQRDDTVNRFIGAGLIEMKLREAGKDDFTPEEEENLKAAARNQYEQLWQGLWQRAQDSGEDFTEAQSPNSWRTRATPSRPSTRNTRPPSDATARWSCTARISR
ncbi:MAG: hypothetical protein IJ089_11250 [Clostridia bacterium]|nr:hypothetical protein [Clostridia bacterium]